MLEQHFVDVLTCLVFGSDYISDIGLDYDTTLQICPRDFQGEEIVEQTTENDTEYQGLRIPCIQMHIEEDSDTIMRTRREIIQYTRALKLQSSTKPFSKTISSPKQSSSRPTGSLPIRSLIMTVTSTLTMAVVYRKDQVGRGDQQRSSSEKNGVPQSPTLTTSSFLHFKMGF